MECDKDFGLVNQKARVEMSNEWIDVFKTAREEPFPFDLVEVTQDMFRTWTEHLSPLNKPKCSFKSGPVREVKIEKQTSAMIVLSIIMEWTVGKRNFGKP